MLVVQMSTTHAAMTSTAQKVADAGSWQLRESYKRSMTRLSRTYLAQMDALKRYRAKAQQVVRVERVTVNDGGQAIVGPVTHQGQGDDENRRQPHAPGAAAQGRAQVRREGQEHRTAVRVPGGARMACLPPARGAGRRARRAGSPELPARRAKCGRRSAPGALKAAAARDTPRPGGSRRSRRMMPDRP